MWLKDDKWLGLIEKWWKDIEVSGSNLYRVISKLKVIKNNLLRWNKTHFGNIFEAKVKLEEEMSKVNKRVIEKGIDEALYLEEKKLLANYEDILAKEEVFWHQKSREMWLSEGDKNTKFLHNSTRQRRLVNRITKIRTSEGSITKDHNHIASEVVKYYEGIFNNWAGSNLGSRD